MIVFTILKVLLICTGASKAKDASIRDQICVFGGSDLTAWYAAYRLKSDGEIAAPILVFNTDIGGSTPTHIGNLMDKMKVELEVNMQMKDVPVRNGRGQLSDLYTAVPFSIDRIDPKEGFAFNYAIHRHIQALIDNYASESSPLKAIHMATINPYDGVISPIYRWFTNLDIPQKQLRYEIENAFELFGQIRTVEFIKGAPFGYHDFITYSLGYDGMSWGELASEKGFLSLAQILAPNSTTTSAFQVISNIKNYAVTMLAVGAQAAGLKAGDIANQFGRDLMTYTTEQNGEISDKSVYIWPNGYQEVKQGLRKDLETMGVMFDDMTKFRITTTDKCPINVAGKTGDSRCCRAGIVATTPYETVFILDQFSFPKEYHAIANQVSFDTGVFNMAVDISGTSGEGLKKTILEGNRHKQTKLMASPQISCSKGDASIREIIISDTGDMVKVQGFFVMDQGDNIETVKKPVTDFAVGVLQKIGLEVTKDNVMEMKCKIKSNIKGYRSPNNLYRTMTDINSDISNPLSFVNFGIGPLTAMMDMVDVMIPDVKTKLHQE